MLVQQNSGGMDVAMSNPHISNRFWQNLSLRRHAGRNPAAGFSLVELMVAMALFLVVGGAAVSLMRSHMPLFNTAQNQTVLNITLRNAVAQMQMEVVNAGTGFSGAGAVAFSPMGATIGKAANANCNATATYVAGCFDSLSLISVDPAVPPLAPSIDVAGANPVDTTASTTIFLTNPGNPAGATPLQYAAWAASLTRGTELMLVQGGTDVANNPTGQPFISIIVLSADATVVGNSLQLTTAGKNGSPLCPNSPFADPLRIYDPGECGRFTNIFRPGLDYVVKLATGTTYSVDASNPANPKLVRTDVTGNVDIIAEQIIGFTVGAWSSQRCLKPHAKPCVAVPVPGYTTDPDDYNSDWASVRSIQVQLVARATPNSDNVSTFKNTYDQGPYQVQAISVVINPRNLNTN
jgi:prepilin-type N-terminal cleavage/methylation domain-containing protein